MKVGEQYNTAGFTLLEMLISLALLALFALMLGGALHFGVLADRHVAQDVTVSTQLARARGFLRDRLESAWPVWQMSQSLGHVDFTADKTTMIFDAPTPQALNGIGISQYTLRVEHTLQGDRLTGSVAPSDRNGHFGAAIMALLWSGPSIGMEFRYYGTIQADLPPLWQTQWSSQESLPMVIAVRADPNAPSHAVWPDLTIRPVINADVGCELDVQTARCRGR